MGRRAVLLGGGGTVALLAAGCGGGDGGSTPTPSPAPAPPPSATPAPVPTPTPPASGNLAVGAQNWTGGMFVPAAGATISSTVSQDVVIDGRPVRLWQVTLPEAGSLIRYIPATSPFIAGRSYLVSFYARLAGEGEGFVWSRQVSAGGPGQEPKLLTASVRRIWFVVHATARDGLAPLTVPQSALPLNPGQGMPVLLCRGAYAGSPVTLLAGGLQVEEIATERQAIALIGDSTQNLDSNFIDAQPVVTPAKWLAGELNVSVLNRAVSGNATGDMLARWNRDMAPLAATARWALIQGGVNDVHRGISFETAQSNISEMASRAEASGMAPVLCTVTPTHYATPEERPMRDRLNAWIRGSFARVIDLDAALRDSADPQRIPWTFTHDGTHFSPAGSRAAGLAMAAGSFWNPARPSAYNPVG